MCAVDTMKRQFDATLTVACLDGVDDIDAMIIPCEYEPNHGNARKRRRVVRFNEQNNEVHDVVVDDDTWLSKKHYRQIRDGVLRDIRAVADSALQPKALLDETVYTGSKGNDDEPPQQAPWGAPSETILENLTQWAQYIDPGRGLESQINGKLGKARRKHRVRAIRAVMVSQRIAGEEECKVAAAGLVGLVSQKYSALAKEHALLMGKADQKAAQDVFISRGFSGNC